MNTKEMMKITYKVCFVLSAVAMVLTFLLPLIVGVVPGIGIAIGLFLFVPGIVLAFIGVVLFLLSKFFGTNDVHVGNDNFFSSTSKVLIISAIVISGVILLLTK